MRNFENLKVEIHYGESGLIELNYSDFKDLFTFKLHIMKALEMLTTD